MIVILNVICDEAGVKEPARRDHSSVIIRAASPFARWSLKKLGADRSFGRFEG
jgi:hypothetical protein